MYLTVHFYKSLKNLVIGGTLFIDLSKMIAVDFIFKTKKNKSKFRVKTIEQLTHYMKETISHPSLTYYYREKAAIITIPNFPEYLLLEFPCLTEDIKENIKKWISKKKFKQKLSTRKENPYKQISHYHGRTR